MFHSRTSGLLRRTFLIVACATAVSLSACGKESGALQPYNAAISESSISGISSGGFMAVQFGTAWSSVIKGVGIVAGGPFYCAQAASSDLWNGYTRPIFTATGPCMKGPAPDVKPLIAKADEKAAAGEIDPTNNLSHQKIYVFHGFNDTVVAQTVTDATVDFYRHYLGREGAGNLFYQTNLGAGHAQVLGHEERYGKLNACELNQSPYINECGYDQAGVILQHIYGALNSTQSRQTVRDSEKLLAREVHRFRRSRLFEHGRHWLRLRSKGLRTRTGRGLPGAYRAAWLRAGRGGHWKAIRR